MLLVELIDFEGWTAEALRKETKFKAWYFHDIERLAVDSDSRWEKGVTALIKLFTKASVRYYSMPEVNKARQLIREA